MCKLLCLAVVSAWVVMNASSMPIGFGPKMKRVIAMLPPDRRVQVEAELKNMTINYQKAVDGWLEENPKCKKVKGMVMNCMSKSPNYMQKIQKLRSFMAACQIECGAFPMAPAGGANEISVEDVGKFFAGMKDNKVCKGCMFTNSANFPRDPEMQRVEAMDMAQKHNHHTTQINRALEICPEWITPTDPEITPAVRDDCLQKYRAMRRGQVGRLEYAKSMLEQEIGPQI